MDTLLRLFQELSTNPATWLGLTLTAFIFGQHVYRWTRYNPLATPTNVAVILIIAILLVLNVPYTTYFEGASFIHFLLGPATVVLAIPVFEQRAKLVQMWLPLTVGLIVGCLVSIVAVITLGWAFGLSSATIVSMVPKSVTTPIAMGISESLGGIPDLTAAIVVITGVIGSALGRPLFRLCKIQDDPVCGVSLGLTAHGMGTSMAFQISNEAGSFAGLTMGVMGILSAFVAPLVAPPLMAWLGL